MSWREVIKIINFADYLDAGLRNMENRPSVTGTKLLVENEAYNSLLNGLEHWEQHFDSPHEILTPVK